jgi:DNA polymerase-3 subunit delta'
VSEDANEGGPPHPRETAEILGHEAAEKALLDAFNSNRMHHAWLISGPRGIGKATLAYRFARFLLSQGPAQTAGLFGAPEAPDSLAVSPESPVFRRVVAGGHGELLSIERQPDPKSGKLKSVISVEEVREIGGFLHMTASEGGWRIVVIDSADEMNVNAANAVLKILEEPPARAMILLISHNPGRLLPTIRSRCRRLQLRPLSDETVTRLLTGFFPDLNGEDARVLARIADGSIGRAAALAEEGGLDLYGEVDHLLESVPGIDVAALHGLGDKVARAGADNAFRTLCDLFQWRLGRLILSGAGGAPADDPAERAASERLLALAPLDRWLEVWEKSTRLLGRAERANLDRKQVVLNMFLALDAAARR